ncbi:MAG TPA: 30S ribosome-binding factor RbfA [Clostridiaceae bacterium]|nr:30S ribosome-binding factor RbfA [Clostridiaceae bacterium]
MSFERADRIAEELKREISDLIRNEIRDPRIAEFTSITSVEVTRDLRYAKVFVSVLGDDKQKDDTLSGLKSAAGFVRREIGKRVKLRYTPEILFEIDKSIEHGIYISKLIDKVNKAGEDKK